MAAHSSALAWKTPWTEEPGGCSPSGRYESDTTERLHFHFSLSCIGEGNGNPLQCSCLENPRDRGSLVGCRLWGRTESDTTEATQQQQQQRSFSLTTPREKGGFSGHGHQSFMCSYWLRLNYVPC